MTNPNSPQGLPVAAAVAGEFGEDNKEASGAERSGPTVGADDAEADAARSGADTDGGLLGGASGDAHRDSDGVPVGEDDLEADKRRSGA
ncbi:hypothetical protein [Actinoplanes sp. M2I2]|uniref:hypothetical protein n=1 Tax=Actinoplanes sp. M2I2 TaxID=1734444 RepID=UPI0020204C70|nr:hypothetical protein [Actinoplanes sp. M2I2]